MLTIGLDLAAQPKNTAVCVVEWTIGAGRVVELRGNQDDRALLGLVDTPAAKIGIDAPLGWPDPFVAAIHGHRAQTRWPGRQGAQGQLRRELCFRATDLKLLAEGFRPLSVAADKIAVPTMRLAHLQTVWAEAGKPVDRSGAGLIVEVYPAAALFRWGLRSTGYKRAPGRPALKDLVLALRREASWLHFEPKDSELCERDDNAFDAVICALVARAATRKGLTDRPSPDLVARARREGWIHVPRSDSLAKLVR